MFKQKERKEEKNMKYLILAEKPKAKQKMAKAFGGNNFSKDGNEYQLTNSVGHLFQLNNPVEQVDDENEKKKIGDWKNLKNMPWDVSNFKWAKHFISPSTKKVFNQIKADSSGCDAIIIATDTDPSGEGDILGQEIVDALKWDKPVYRMNFKNETASAFQKALENLTDVTDTSTYRSYLKGQGRVHFDYPSMQLVRIAKIAAGTQKINATPNEGRLKSAIIVRVLQQTDAIKNYQKKPYYVIQFVDENGHVYVNSDATHYEKEADAQAAVNQLASSAVGDIKEEEKEQKPPAFLDLLKLYGKTKGISNKTFLKTYQEMYQDDVVSYPRTEDKLISVSDYEELKPLIDDIAKVVNVDTSLLTHREPRLKTHYTEKATDHGANRPGPNVPDSLDSLDSTYGPGAKQIYDILARSFLASVAENYIFNNVTGKVVDYPDYTTNFKIPVKQNWRLITDDVAKEVKPIGTTAKPETATKVNKKPAEPTIGLITSFLEKYDIGTGATRVSTLSALIDGKRPLLQQQKHKLDLTDLGIIAATLATNTWIADPTFTKKLFDEMDKIGKGQKTLAEMDNITAKTIKHDMEIIMQNSSKLKESGINLDKFAKAIVNNDVDTKITCPLCGKDTIHRIEMTKKDKSFDFYSSKCGLFIPHVLAGHTIDVDELQKLLNGESVEAKMTSKKGNPFTGILTFNKKKKNIELKFPKQEGEDTGVTCPKCKKGNLQLVSFKTKAGKPFKVYTCTNDKCKLSIPASLAGHSFSTDEIVEIVNGENKPHQYYTGKNGKKFSASVAFHPRSKRQISFVFPK